LSCICIDSNMGKQAQPTLTEDDFYEGQLFNYTGLQ
jgi:hypothetical protein